MKPWLKSLLGSGEFTELPEELSKLLDQAKRDKRALRDLLKRSETASKKIEYLADRLEANRAAAESLDVQVAQLQMRATVLEDSVSRLELLEQRTVRLVKEAAFGEMGGRRLWLDVYDFNDRARSIYEAEGFEAESERPASEACGGCAEGTAIVMAVERA